MPLGFLSGVTGAFSKALSITMAAALAISYLMTAFVVPVLARVAGRFRALARSRRRPADGLLARAHSRLLDRLFCASLAVRVVLVPLLARRLVRLSQACRPASCRRSTKAASCSTTTRQPGTSLTETGREVARSTRSSERRRRSAPFPAVSAPGSAAISARVYHGDYFVRLKPDHARSTPEVMAAVLAEVAGQGARRRDRAGAADGGSDRRPDGGAAADRDQAVSAPTPAALIPQAEKVAAAISRIDGVVEVKSGVKLAGDALDMQIDPVQRRDRRRDRRSTSPRRWTLR